MDGRQCYVVLRTDVFRRTEDFALRDYTLIIKELGISGGDFHAYFFFFRGYNSGRTRTHTTLTHYARPHTRVRVSQHTLGLILEA